MGSLRSEMCKNVHLMTFQIKESVVWWFPRVSQVNHKYAHNCQLIVDESFSFPCSLFSTHFLPSLLVYTGFCLHHPIGIAVVKLAVPLNHQSPLPLSLSYFNFWKHFAQYQLLLSGNRSSLGFHDLILTQWLLPTSLTFVSLPCWFFLLCSTSKCWNAPELPLGLPSLFCVTLCSGLKTFTHSSTFSWCSSGASVSSPWIWVELLTHLLCSRRDHS